MKILYLSRAELPSEKSQCLSIMRMCQAFADAGHETVLTGIDNQKIGSDPISFYGLKGGFRVILNRVGKIWENALARYFLLPGVVLAWKTRMCFAEFRPDIVYSRLTITELLFVPRDIPIVYEMHSLGPLGQRWVRRQLFRAIMRFKNLRRLVVTTETLAVMLREEMPGVEIVIARLSAEPPVEIEKAKLQAFRDKNLQGRTFAQHVGYTGYMDTVGLRGTDILIRTAERMPDTAFHIVGGEPDIVEHWRSFAESHNEGSNIFFYGYRNPIEIPYFLNCFDVVVAPLQHRPDARAPIGQNMSPLKLPQYMGYSKAIVASDLPAHRECLVAGETATLVKCDDVQAWVAAIAELLHDPDKRTRMGRNGWRVYDADYRPDIRVGRILGGLK